MRTIRKPRTALLMTCALLTLGGLPSQASPVGDAKAGQAALDQGDNATAVRLFTKALNSGGLSRADRELAYVDRAKAYSAQQKTAAAQADLRKALKLDPQDREARDLLAALKPGGAGYVWLSIATDDQGAFTVQTGGNEKEAQRRALAGCNNFGKGCHLTTTINNNARTCFAITKAPGRHTVTTTQDLDAARSLASNECQKGLPDGEVCELVDSGCNDKP